MSTFRLPDLGEGLQDAEIVAWQVSEGDHVAADQPLVSVETAKAVVEIPSPQSGRIERLHGQPGDIVAVGAPLVEFDGAQSGGGEAIVGELPHGGKPAEAAPRQPEQEQRGPKAMPATRRLAAELGVDLASIAGTGPDGIITAADVQRAAAGPAAAAGTPLRGPRRAMAQAMTGSGKAVVPATVTADADVSDWIGNDDPTVRLIQAMVAGCSAVPVLNGWFDGTRLAIERHADVDLGLAVDTDDGLFVPVIRNANRLDTSELRDRLGELKQQTVSRSIAPRDMQGATITLSNFGMIGGDHASLVVTPPQVAILGAGRITERVVAIDNRPAVRSILPLSLSFDHRTVTGGEAARFLMTVIAHLEDRTEDVQ